MKLLYGEESNFGLTAKQNWKNDWYWTHKDEALEERKELPDGGRLGGSTNLFLLVNSNGVIFTKIYRHKLNEQGDYSILKETSPYIPADTTYIMHDNC